MNSIQCKSFEWKKNEIYRLNNWTCKRNPWVVVLRRHSRFIAIVHANSELNKHTAHSTSKWDAFVTQSVCRQHSNEKGLCIIYHCLSFILSAMKKLDLLTTPPIHVDDVDARPSARAPHSTLTHSRDARSLNAIDTNDELLAYLYFHIYSSLLQYPFDAYLLMCNETFSHSAST